jgi:hypothetical protein
MCAFRNSDISIFTDNYRGAVHESQLVPCTHQILAEKNYGVIITLDDMAVSGVAPIIIQTQTAEEWPYEKYFGARWKHNFTPIKSMRSLMQMKATGSAQPPTESAYQDLGSSDDKMDNISIPDASTPAKVMDKEVIHGRSSFSTPITAEVPKKFKVDPQVRWKVLNENSMQLLKMYVVKGKCYTIYVDRTRKLYLLHTSLQLNYILFGTRASPTFDKSIQLLSHFKFLNKLFSESLSQTELSQHVSALNESFRLLQNSAPATRPSADELDTSLKDPVVVVASGRQAESR